jgi:hypothetical protein
MVTKDLKLSKYMAVKKPTEIPTSPIKKTDINFHPSIFNMDLFVGLNNSNLEVGRA